MLFGTGYYHAETLYRGQGKGVKVYAKVVKITFEKVEEAGNKYHPGYFIVVLENGGGEYALARGVSPPQLSYQFLKKVKSEKDRLEKMRKKEAKAQAPPGAFSRAATKLSSALCGGSPC